MDQLNEQLIGTIEKALEATTPGPWTSKDNEILTEKTDRDGYRTIIAKKTKHIGYEHDVEFIANSPTWLRALLELNTELREELDGLKGSIGVATYELSRFRSQMGFPETSWADRTLKNIEQLLKGDPNE